MLIVDSIMISGIFKAMALSSKCSVFLFLVVLSLLCQYSVDGHAMCEDLFSIYSTNSVPLHVDVSCNKPAQGIIQPRNSTEDNDETYIILSNSCLSAMPLNLCEFKNIHAIDLQYNNIEEIADITCLQNLVYLNLQHNKIRTLKTGVFDSLSSLVSIRLSYNLIQTIELGVFHPGLDCILEVDLDNNRLTEMDLWILNITHWFNMVSMANNQITRVTNKGNFKIDTTKTYGPGHVDLRNNSFVEWDLSVLKNVYPQNEEMSYQYLFGLLIDWGFDFRDNPWNCDCRLYNLMSIDKLVPEILQRPIYLVDVRCHSPLPFNGMRIVDLRLSDFVCNVTQSCPPSCLCQEQPDSNRMVIDCQNAGLVNMPKVLPFHKSLFLYFRNNYIKHLPELSYMRSIHHLDISNNTLSSISSSSFYDASELLHLNMSNNELQDLSKSIQNLGQTTIIDITNNPLQCSCSNLWIWRWIKSEPTNYKEIECALPNDEQIVLHTSSMAVLDCHDSKPKNTAVAIGVTGACIAVAVVCCLYFRYELLTLYHLYIYAKFCGPPRKSDENNVYVILDEANDAERQWVKEHLISYFDDNLINSYIPFRDGVPGEVTSDANITCIHNSCVIIAVMSTSMLENASLMFELREAYRYMVRQGNGKMIIIKPGELDSSVIKDGYLRSMFRLKQFTEAEDMIKLYSVCDHFCVSNRTAVVEVLC